ncbi:MAG TPA: SH3 domain-containing protein [Syntrophorhabdaceae bacterium]|nr:SH3 domain-containing protein [Syntrophorhabdaceae bacterium]
MKEAYIEYWGLESHPFLMAPDSHMMYMAGQYYECLERLKYAVNTHKGGALIVSEDAGLGKTTIILKLIEELKAQYGEAFRYALVDHPTLDPAQMISFIAGAIAGYRSHEDKLKNILVLKDSLIEVKKMEGKAIIVVDEGQMLCGAYDILQELRVLINLTHENEYLHTFILSGQRPLWEEIKRLPEFWQRLPIRYYFVPLRLEETREMIKFRLRQAGMNSERRIFSEDAFEMIHRFAKGSPRTIIALADLALLIGYTDRAGVIGFKEMTKALHVMSGRGESLPYISQERENKKISFDKIRAPKISNESVKTRDLKATTKDYSSDVQQNKYGYKVRPFFIILFCVTMFIAGGAGYHYLFGSHNNKYIAANKKDIEISAKISEIQKEISNKPIVDEQKKIKEKPATFKKAIIIKEGANIRSAPDIVSQRVGMIFKGQSIEILEEKKDKKGENWYKIKWFGEREGWISERVAKMLEDST